MTSSTAVLTATATETATPKHCAAAPLGSQCVGTDRLEALIERSGVLDTKTLNQLRNLVNEGKFKEADLAVFAKLAANVQAGRGSAAIGAQPFRGRCFQKAKMKKTCFLLTSENLEYSKVRGFL
jgi:hypothetical protein